MAGTTESGKRGLEAGEADEVASPIAVEKYLKGISFPTQKEQLLQQAEKNQAPESVLKALRQLPGDSFESPVEISKGIADE